jgi:hypothetical protein
MRYHLLGRDFLLSFTSARSSTSWRQNGLAGAIQLMQMQEDLKKQLEAGDTNGEEAIESYLESKQKIMLDSLWKLNVADIELTLSRVCQAVWLPTRSMHFEIQLFRSNAWSSLDSSVEDRRVAIAVLKTS